MQKSALVMAVLPLVVCWTAYAQKGPKLEPLLTQGFEEGEVGSLPEGWSRFTETEGLSISADQAHEGKQALLMVDESQTEGVGLRSPKTPVEPGEIYYVQTWYYGELGNNASIYLEFWDAEGKRIEDQVHSFGCVGKGEWGKYLGSGIAPANAVAATVLPYSYSKNTMRGYYDDIVLGKGVPVIYDRTPQPPAPVEHPCGLYRQDDIERAKQNLVRHEWARKAFENIKNSARWWMELPDEQIADWIPELTPFRVCNCPKCGAQWGIDPWTNLPDGRIKCRKCGTVFPNEDFPEKGTEVLINPLGQKVEYHFYSNEEGEKFRLSGRCRYARISRLGSLGYLGRAYALTGDVAYANKVRKVLLRLAKVYPGYIAHDWYHIFRDYNNLQSGKMSGWKLHDASCMIELCLAYDLTYNTGVYSDEDKSLIEEGVFREAARLITTTSPRGCCVNDGPFLMGAGAYLGKILGEHQYVAWALEPPQGFFAFLEENFWRDGHWEDGSPSYEGMALNKFYVLPEIINGYSDPPSYQGADRYDKVDMFAHPLMKKVLIAGMHNFLPDMTLPPINDSVMGAHYGTRHAEENYLWFPTKRNLRLMDFAYGGDAADSGGEYSLFRRPPDLSFAGVEPLDLSVRSLVRPGLGWAILRHGDKPDSTMLVCDFGPSRGHSHPDKLNYLFYAYRREIVQDQGYLGARHHYTPWNHSTAAHNEVLVDGDAQLRTSGELLSFITGDFAQSVRAKAPAVYPKKVDLYERTLVMVTPQDGSPYVVDVFRVSGGERHVMAFHGDGEEFEAALPFSPYDGEVVTEQAGAKWLKNMERADPTDNFAVTWNAVPPDQPDLRLTVLDPALTNVYHCTAPGLRNRSDPWGERTLHLLFREQPGPRSTFVSVAEAVKGHPRLSGIERVGCSNQAVMGVRIEREGCTDYVFVGDEASSKDTVQCAEPAGLDFQGRQAVVSIDEDGPRFAQLVEGRSLTLGNISLTCPGPMTGTIASYDDEADTITTNTKLPVGEALRGQQLLVAGRVDGAYEIDRVEEVAEGSVVHLADEPIMRVAEGDKFSIPSVIEVRRLDNGVFAVRADCEMVASLPRPAQFSSQVLLRVGDAWREVPYEKADSTVTVHLDPAQLQGSSALLLFDGGGINLNDFEPPQVEAVRLGARTFPGASHVDLGYQADPHTVAVELRDAMNDISEHALSAQLESSGNARGRIEARLVRDAEDARCARVIVALRDLGEGKYALRLSFYDKAANRGEVTISFNTQGLAFPATELAILDDSGKLSKPLGGLDTQFYRAQEVGDFVTYALPIEDEGDYAVSVIATTFSSYGTYQVSIDGSDLGEPVDAYTRELGVGSLKVKLGTLHLRAGTHRLRLTIVGHNAASENYYIGLHSIVLKPVQEQGTKEND